VDASPRALRRRRFYGGLLVACALAMITAAFWFLPAVWTVVLIVVGVNALMMGGRLLLVNAALRERETARQRRLTSWQASRDQH
jgi:cobalamin biosynthesis protein CobD/CbiB